MRNSFQRLSHSRKPNIASPGTTNARNPFVMNANAANAPQITRSATLRRVNFGSIAARNAAQETPVTNPVNWLSSTANVPIP